MASKAEQVSGMRVEPIGWVRRVSDTEYMIEVAPEFREGLDGIEQGSRLDVHYWMHRLAPDKRDWLKVHPRGDKTRPVRGVFGLRSPLPPNPIGVSAVRVLSVESGRLAVTPFDAEDGSPVVDLKASSTGAEVKALVRTWGSIHDAVFRNLEGEIGEKELKRILYRPMYELGRKEAPEGKIDAREIGREIMKFEASWNLEGSILEDRAERFAREVNCCPWSYFSPLGCKVFVWWMEGYCAGMNPEFVYRLEHLIPEGDKTCVWAVARRDERK
jgi:L-fuculose-phosphate aldolase